MADPPDLYSSRQIRLRWFFRDWHTPSAPNSAGDLPPVWYHGGTIAAAKLVSGAASDRLRRRKPIIILGYVLSAAVKTVFPVAGDASAILAARVVDRAGKGVRDAPRDALLADITAREIRGTGFGLRLAIAIQGFAVGPLIAIGLMTISGGDFRLVFWVALIPAYLSIALLVFTVKELSFAAAGHPRRLPMRRADAAMLPSSFWWAIAFVTVMSLALFSQAFLVLEASDIGMNIALVPLVLVMMHLAFSLSAYPFGVLADRIDRRRQLGIGAGVLIAAGVVLAGAGNVWMVALGAALWGLQLGVTQGLLGAAVADASPDHMRGAAFGIFDVAVGVSTFIASAGAGSIWAAWGPPAAFGLSACFATAAAPFSCCGPCQIAPLDRPTDLPDALHRSHAPVLSEIADRHESSRQAPLS